jgi:hypothetical protein
MTPVSSSPNIPYLHLLEGALEDNPDERVDENGLVERDDNAFLDCLSLETRDLDISHVVDVPEADLVHVARFDAHLMVFCKFMVNWCRECGCEAFFVMDNVERPMCIFAFLLLVCSDSGIIALLLSSFIPGR